ncbi:hypothetical protein D3C85_1641880 [compost metagenome]
MIISPRVTPAAELRDVLQLVIATVAIGLQVSLESSEECLGMLTTSSWFVIIQNDVGPDPARAIEPEV